MSTVLTNGIIIPDNGSRNWGGDLANNWNIIDVNVGYMNDVKNKVTTLENSVAENTTNIQTNASNISALQTSKQDVIEDLETIRTGASSGATAVQPSELNNYATKSELANKANDSDVVHKSGDEILNGTKTFTVGPVCSNYATVNGFFIKNNAIARNEVPSQFYHSTFRVNDKNNKTLGEFCIEKSTSGYSLLNMNVKSENDDGIEISKGLFLVLANDGSDVYFRPSTNNEFGLGTSSKKWKTLNGINPGALSMPKYDEYVTLTFRLNAQIQATFTGFLQVKANVSSGAYLIVTINNLEIASVSPSANTGHILVPINQDDQIYVTVTNGEYLGYGSLIIFKAQGNV